MQPLLCTLYFAAQCRAIHARGGLVHPPISVSPVRNRLYLSLSLYLTRFPSFLPSFVRFETWRVNVEKENVTRVSSKRVRRPDRANELVIISVAWFLLISLLIRPRLVTCLAVPPALISPEKCHRAANCTSGSSRGQLSLSLRESFNLFLRGGRIFFLTALACPRLGLLLSGEMDGRERSSTWRN